MSSVFEVVYQDGGSRKAIDKPSYKEACNEVIELDRKGYIPFYINKLNSHHEIINNVWKVNEDEKYEDALNRLKVIIEKL